MSPARLVIGLLIPLIFLHVPTGAARKPKPVCSPPKDPAVGYKHARFAPEADLQRKFQGFEVSFDSKDDDDGEPGADLLRVPHWVAQEIRSWKPPAEDRDKDDAWCLDTLEKRPKWFTDDDLFASGVAPNDDSYRSSGFDRGHMAMKLLVERLGQDAAFKVVIREKTGEGTIQVSEGPEVLAFLYPQLGPGYFGPSKDYRHERFLTTVDEIEGLTGLDFKLSTDAVIEKNIERSGAPGL